MLWEPGNLVATLHSAPSTQGWHHLCSGAWPGLGEGREAAEGGGWQCACLPGQNPASCPSPSSNWNFPWEGGSMAFPSFFFYKFIYLFLAVLGLRFCARAFSSCGERGPLFIAVRGPLTMAASLVAERRLSRCGSRAQLLCGVWDLPRPGLKPVSPALAGGFSTAAPPGKPRLSPSLIPLLGTNKMG